MAQSLSKHLFPCAVSRLYLWGLAFILLMLATLANAADPTRPPPEFTKGNTVTEVQPTNIGPGLVLQSVLISPKRQRALISGQTIPLGGRIGDAKLIKITETHVVLQSAQGLQTLELTPGISKRQPEALAKPQNNKKQRHSGGKP